MEINSADGLVQPAGNRGLSHARGKHFPDALPQFWLREMVERVGHSKIVSHRLAGETCGAECPSLSGHPAHKVQFPSFRSTSRTRSATASDCRMFSGHTQPSPRTSRAPMERSAISERASFCVSLTWP